MFGFSASAAAIAASQAKHTLEQTKALHDLMRETLSVEDYEKWRQERTEERRHQETLKAIRDSKPEPQEDISLARVIIGACLLGSIMGD